MTPRRALLVPLLALVLALGCGASTTPDPVDASHAHDSGPVDASHAHDSGPVDATVSSDAGGDASTPGSCDQRRVLCDSIPPSCGPGEAPSVSGACWGPCVLATSCTCTTADECPDVPGYSETCHTGRGRCGPYL